MVLHERADGCRDGLRPGCRTALLHAGRGEGSGPGCRRHSSLAIAKGRDYAWHGAVDGLVVNDTTYDCEERAGLAGATGPAGLAGAPGVTTVVQVPTLATAASGAARATACRGDELRVLRAPRRKGEKFLSVRATLRGERLKVDGRQIRVDLRHQPEGNYNVRLTTRHRKANGSVRTVKTTRNLSVVCS